MPTRSRSVAPSATAAADTPPFQPRSSTTHRSSTPSASARRANPGNSSGAQSRSYMTPTRTFVTFVMPGTYGVGGGWINGVSRPGPPPESGAAALSSGALSVVAGRM